jgi:SAM-dependent methyltransferase
VSSGASDNRWLASGRRAEDYDRRFDELATTGVNIHGEADLVASLGVDRVLDAGCGTGRLAIELARRGIDVVGVDLDGAMLGVARAKAPHIPWIEADLSDLDIDRTFDAIVMAGNVMIFVTPGTEGAVVANLGRHLRADGVLVAGFSVVAGGLSLDGYDRLAADAGLVLADRWATWARDPFVSGGDYAVTVHRRTTGR